VKHFNLGERIELQTKVVNISRCPTGGHTISYVRKRSQNSEEWETTPQTINAPYIVLCTGLHVIPSVPTIEGIEHVLKPRDSDRNLQRTAFHSVDYKSRSQLVDRRIVILGTERPEWTLRTKPPKQEQRRLYCARELGLYLIL